MPDTVPVRDGGMQADTGSLPVLGAWLARHASARVIASLAALVGLSLLLSLFAVQRLVERQAQLQWQAEARALSQGIRSLGRALANEARDYGWWDDAVRHLAIRIDADWADANVGRYIHDSFGYEASAQSASIRIARWRTASSHQP